MRSFVTVGRKACSGFRFNRAPGAACLGLMLALGLCLAPGVRAQHPAPLSAEASRITEAADTAGDCPKGRKACVDKVIHRMDRRFNTLARRCGHEALFSLLYLRTTETFRRAIEDPTFFRDTPYLIRQDVIFGEYYFRAYDDWYLKNRRSSVPPAWQIAFEAAENRAITGIGNLLLGVNAHISRDLPFVLAGLGLTYPDGSSRKPDHDRVNDFLWWVIEPALDEAARRFDPSINDARVKGTVYDEMTYFQAIVAWREEAWRNAERLVAAVTLAERERVTREIEDASALRAYLIREQNAYRPPLTTAEARDAWCAVHGREETDPAVSDRAQDRMAPEAGGARAFALSAAYPNPFNPRTAFSLTLEAGQDVRIEVFNLLGQRVAVLHEGFLSAGGEHRFTFEPGGLPGGTYLLRATGAHTGAQRMLVLLK